jgi:hypothetical protein
LLFVALASNVVVFNLLFVLQHDHGTWNSKPSLTIGGEKYFGNEKKE